MSMFPLSLAKLSCSFLFVLSLLAGFSPYAYSDGQLTSPAVQFERDTIVIARVSTNPKKHYKHLKPIADYLAANLSEFGISRGKVIFAKDNEQMIRYIKQGKVDVITETAVSAALFKEQAGAELLLRRWKGGVAEYSSVIFSRMDSGVDSFEDLQGKVIAFQDRGSSSSFFIPASIMIRDGYELYELDTPRELPPQDKIGFVFADKEINISAWVHKGIVAAGAFSNLDWNNTKDMPAEFHKDLAVFYESALFPRGIELVRPDLDPVIKNRIKQVLMTAHEKEAGRQALTAYQQTEKYDELKGKSYEGVKLAAEFMFIVENKL